MKLGLGRLRHAPAVFWRMTMLELSAAAEGLAEHMGGGDPQSMTRDRLAELMTLYPDTPHG